jgi:D-beta-D-heptose 7-phosphate kinase / D-beta-D-heptose 1-phosphate adenosyltransferase
MDDSRLDEAYLTCTALQAVGQKVVLTNGVFDLLHLGHVRLLQKARQQGDFLMVAVNDDESTRILKGEGRPLYDQWTRVEMLSALRWVDFAFLFGHPSVYDTVELLRPDVLVKGGEYDTAEVVGAELVQSYGGTVQTLDVGVDVHSTRVLECLRGGEGEGVL